MDRFKARRVESRDLGLCTYSGCHKKHAPGRALCVLHLRKEAKRNKDRRESMRISSLPPFPWLG